MSANRLTLDEQLEKYEQKLKEVKQKIAEREKRENAAAEKELLQHAKAYASQQGCTLSEAVDKIRDLLFGKQMTIEDLPKQKKHKQQDEQADADNMDMMEFVAANG